MKRIFILFLLVLASQASVFAEATEFNPEVKRIAVFKNGYVFTYREAETTTPDGWVYTTDIPSGVIGTVWGYTNNPKTKVTRIMASHSEKIVKIPGASNTVTFSTLAEILAENQGAQIKIETNREPKRIYQGSYRLVDNGDRQTMALKTESGTLFLPYSMIETFEILGNLKTERVAVSEPTTTSTPEDRLSLNIEGTSGNQPVGVGIAALQRGIRWIPAYRIELKGEEAKIELEAMLINDLTELKDAEVNFVVGVPHFLFQETLSPMSLDRAFAGVSESFARSSPGISPNVSNAMMTQLSSSADITSGAESIGNTAISDDEKATSFSAEQLYVYQADKVSLKSGDRMSMKLFSQTVPVTEVFEWVIKDNPQTAVQYMSSSTYAGPGSLISTVDLSNKIWYGLKLKNTTGMPWTTAPALSFRDWKPMGQDMLTFTPIGGENILKVTPATEITGDHTLEEVQRIPQKRVYRGGTYDFDLITVEGTVKLHNYRKQAADIVISRSLAGEVLSASDGGKFVKEGVNLQELNPNSRVKWNVKVQPGPKELKYRYQIYVRK